MNVSFYFNMDKSLSARLKKIVKILPVNRSTNSTPQMVLASKEFKKQESVSISPRKSIDFLVQKPKKSNKYKKLLLQIKEEEAEL